MFDRIRLQLTASYVAILALILIVFGIVVTTVFADQLAARQDSRLAQQAHSKAESILEGRGQAFFSAPGEPIAVWAPVAPDGRVLNPPRLSVNVPEAFASRANRPSPSSEKPADPPTRLKLLSEELARRSVREKRTHYSTITAQEGDVRVVSLPVMRAGEVIAVVQVAEPSELVQGTVTRLILILMPIGLAALLLAALGGLAVSRRAIRPVKEAFDRQRTFVADASHELKTPLTLMRIDAEMLAQDPAQSGGGELAEELVTETDRMSTLVSDLLLLARLDAGKVAIGDKPFDLNVVIAETANRFQKRAQAEDVSLETRAEGRLEARGDPGRTSQILAALVDNALHFTSKGGHVTITGRSANRRVEAIVRDNGPGIAAEHMPYIFDRYYRAEAARSREGGGTGLGLAIARDLARAQGGELAAEKAEDNGAVFCLSLPTNPGA
jgi:two-component system sensor histidine kinase CiaH